MRQAQQEVNDILSSIRQMISEEENVTSSNTLSSSEPVLDLTKMVQEDGSVVQLSAAPQVSDLPGIEPLTIASKEQESPMTFPEPSKSFVPQSYQEETVSSASPYQQTAFEQPSKSESAFLSSMSASNPSSSESEPFQKKEKSGHMSPAEFLSQDTLQESAAAFAALARATERRSFPENSNPTVETVGDYTIDALMRDLLKPLLKEWLDAHLPSLVRALVLEQIEKVLQQRNKAGS